MSATGPSQVQDAGVQTASAGNSTNSSTSATSTTSPNSASTSTSTNATSSSSSSQVAQEDLICRWNQCNERFSAAETLYDHICERHVGRKSTNNLNLTCQWNSCRTTTVKRDHITSHIRVHVPLKPHKCDFCGKSFKRPQDLKKHVKTHADDSVLVVPGNDSRLSQGPRGGMGNTSSYYAQHGAMRTNEALGQHHQNGQASAYYPQPTSTYGGPPMYYPTAPSQRPDMFAGPGATTASFGDSRKRSYEAVNDFFHSVKRREVDPTSYTQVGRSLMPLHNSLPIHAGSVGNEYMTATAPLPAISTGPSLGGSVATSHANAAPAAPLHQYYSLPRTNDLRTKNDLLQVDRMLETMQGTVYESDPSMTAQTAQAVSAYAQNQVHIRQSQSPPHIHAQPPVMSATTTYPQTSATHMGSPLSAISPAHSVGTPALSPPSSTMSYTSGNSPSASSASFSPASRHSTTAAAGLYPSLSMAPSSSHVTATLGTGFDSGKDRRHSGGLLQKPSRVLSPVVEDKEKEPETAASSPSIQDDPSDTYQEEWLENVRCIEWLRQAIQQRLESGDYENEEAAPAPKNVTLNSSVGEAATHKAIAAVEAESLYPMLKPLAINSP